MKIKPLLALMALAALVGCKSSGVPHEDKKPVPGSSGTRSSAGPRGVVAQNIPAIISRAESGDAESQNDLGVIYRDGLGVERDYKVAAIWFRKAAGQGLAFSQTSLGVMHEEGQGVPRDYHEATRLYQAAASQGDAFAQLNLALGYAKGQGVEQDLTRANAWLAIASLNGLVRTEKVGEIFRRKMSAEQISKAEALAKEMIQENPKLIVTKK